MVTYVMAFTNHSLHDRLLLGVGVLVFLMGTSCLQQIRFAGKRYKGYDRRLTRREPVDYGPGPAGRQPLEEQAESIEIVGADN